MKRAIHLFNIAMLWLPMFAFAGASPEDLDAMRSEAPAPATAVLTAGPSAKPNGSGESVPHFEFYASDKAAQLTYERAGSALGLNNDRAGVSFLLNEQRDNAVSAYIHYDIEPQILPGLTLSFGPKLIAGLLSIENNDVVGLAAGVGADYRLPVRQLPLQLSAVLDYAPDILTFGQSDRIFDWQVRVGLPLTENIDGYVGIRYLQFDTRPGERELDDQVHVGIRWSHTKKGQ